MPRATHIDKFIGKRLKEARIACGMTQKELADKLGVTHQQVQKYQQGINRISASRLAAVSNVTKRPMHWFVDGKESAHMLGLMETRIMAEVSKLSRQKKTALHNYLRAA